MFLVMEFITRDFFDKCGISPQRLSQIGMIAYATLPNGTEAAMEGLNDNDVMAGVLENLRLALEERMITVEELAAFSYWLGVQASNKLYTSVTATYY